MAAPVVERLGAADLDSGNVGAAAQQPEEGLGGARARIVGWSTTSYSTSWGVVQAPPMARMRRSILRPRGREIAQHKAAQFGSCGRRSRPRTLLGRARFLRP